MEFCDNCGDYLYLSEKRNDKEIKLVYSCKKCDFTKHCDKTLIFRKVYKKDDKLDYEKKDINKYLIRDKTLPKKKSQCTSCLTINDNPYQVKYSNNSYNIISFCLDCNTSFPYKKI